MYKPRRPFDDDHPNGYLESDKDYVNNNFELAVQLLNEYRDRINLREIISEKCVHTYHGLHNSWRIISIGREAVKFQHAKKMVNSRGHHRLDFFEFEGPDRTHREMAEQIGLTIAV